MFILTPTLIPPKLSCFQVHESVIRHQAELKDQECSNTYIAS